MEAAKYCHDSLARMTMLRTCVGILLRTIKNHSRGSLSKASVSLACFYVLVADVFVFNLTAAMSACAWTSVSI